MSAQNLSLVHCLVQCWFPLILTLHFPLCSFSAQQESTKKGNMKRENKAYSFKEQIIELELQEVRYFGINIINFVFFFLFFVSVYLFLLSILRKSKRRKELKTRCSLLANNGRWCRTSWRRSLLSGRNCKRWW